MISEHLAVALREAGLRWTPTAGDRFVIPKPGLEGELFTLSEMTIEAHEYATGTVLGFNGTTEWALDSVAQDEALWMPREDQLRERLGAAFASLDAEPGTRSMVVTTLTPTGETLRHEAPSAADAYGLALLDLIGRATGASAHRDESAGEPAA